MDADGEQGDEKIVTTIINARSDGVATKPSSAFKKRWCVIPASCSFEWKTTGTAKQPYHFRRKDGKPFLFAVLWEQWGDPTAPLLTCCFITTDANGTVSKVHDRMPVILSAEQELLRRSRTTRSTPSPCRRR